MNLIKSKIVHELRPSQQNKAAMKYRPQLNCQVWIQKRKYVKS